jgi:anti-anti-sigma factor
MVKSALRWNFSVDRGPDCLFVKLRVPKVTLQESNQLAEKLWKILSRHFVYRLVLEMDEVDRLPSPVIGQLVALKQRIQQHGGMLRLCGLRETCREALDACCLEADLPNYDDRTDAVVGHHLHLPR